MGRRGPKPMPRALRLARGTHLERLNPNEPQPPADTVVAPEWVTGEAREKFDELVPQLRDLGLVTNLDVDAVARYAVTFVEWKKHLAICQKGGDVMVLKDETGRVKFASIAPSATLVAKHSATLLRLAQEFGMTPASRTQVASGAGQHVDHLAEWLKRNEVKESRA
jgi:P27 family predicted phage terminase small subunit